MDLNEVLSVIPAELIHSTEGKNGVSPGQITKIKLRTEYRPRPGERSFSTTPEAARPPSHRDQLDAHLRSQGWSKNQMPRLHDEPIVIDDINGPSSKMDEALQTWAREAFAHRSAMARDERIIETEDAFQIPVPSTGTDTTAAIDRIIEQVRDGQSPAEARGELLEVFNRHVDANRRAISPKVAWIILDHSYQHGTSKAVVGYATAYESPKAPTFHIDGTPWPDIDWENKSAVEVKR